LKPASLKLENKELRDEVQRLDEENKRLREELARYRPLDEKPETPAPAKPEPGEIPQLGTLDAGLFGNGGEEAGAKVDLFLGDKAYADARSSKLKPQQEEYLKDAIRNYGASLKAYKALAETNPAPRCKAVISLIEERMRMAQDIASALEGA
jgi:hypothetical protein